MALRATGRAVTAIVRVVVAIFVMTSLGADAARGAVKPGFTLVSPDQRAAVIVVGAEATAAEKYAADEMATYLEKMSGTNIKVVDDGDDIRDQAHVIAIGRSKLTDSYDTSGLGVEQYIIDVRPNRLVIVGGRRPALPGQPARDAGVLYGVYDFLEGLGARWYRPEPWGEHVPTLTTVRLDIGTTVSKKPAYKLRATMAGGLSYFREETAEETMQARIWAVRNRTNAGFSDRTRWPEEVARFGGLEEDALGTHNWPILISASEYFASHPEYFALVNGERVPYDLCPGNRDLQRLYADKLIARAKANPYQASFSAEPSDGRGGACECTLCKALDEPQNTRPHGQWSNRVAAFGNNVAEMVAEEAPWVKVQWLGYSTHTSAPTNLQQLSPNTAIMLCPINGWDDWTKKLMDPASSSNATFVQAAKDWASLKPSSLASYLYYDGYGWPGPIPATRTVADRMRHYRELGIEGVFLPGVRSWGPGGLDLYMFSRLAWNPDLDVDLELDLYYTNYYGPAATPMKAYHELLMDALETSRYPVRSGGRGMYLIFTPALGSELGKSMDEAQSLVKGNALYERRLNGVWAGYEFSRRISEILSLKKRTGIVSVKVPYAEQLQLPADLERPLFIGGGSYLQSGEAEETYRELVRWMRTMNGGDAVFDMEVHFKDDAAEIVYAKRGHNFGSSFLSYLPQDVLLNSLNQHLREEEVLEPF